MLVTVKTGVQMVARMARKSRKIILLKPSKLLSYPIHYLEKFHVGLINFPKEYANNEQTTNNETSQQNDDNQNNSNDGQTNERPNSPTASVHIQKNYYKSVSENKDVIKIVSLLSTCISSTKKDVLTAVDRFKEYQFIWQNDRDEDLREFLKQDSLSVSEFETKIKSFEVYITEINSHPEYIPIGAIALVTEKLKMGLISEIQIWKIFD